MINNLHLILPLLEFKEEGDFYTLLILERKKDKSTPDSNSQSVRTIKTYTIRSSDYLQSKFEEIQLLCETFKARAYINLNRLNDKTVALEMIKKLVNCLQNNNSNVKGVYDSVVGSLPSKDKKWLIDIDSEELQYKDLYIEAINNCQPNEVSNKIIVEIPTKSGCHLITYPFNTEQFKKSLKVKEPDIQKMNPTLLYVPRALFTDYSLVEVLKSYDNLLTSIIGKSSWSEWVEYPLFYKNETNL